MNLLHDFVSTVLREANKTHRAWQTLKPGTVTLPEFVAVYLSDVESARPKEIMAEAAKEELVRIDKTLETGASIPKKSKKLEKLEAIKRYADLRW